MANVALTNVAARQYPLFASVTVDFTNISTTAVAVTVIKLPPNSVVVGGFMVVDTASNQGTSATLSVGDSGVAARYLGATDIKTAAKTNLVPTGYLNTGGLDIIVTPALVGTAATAGSVRVVVEYIIDGRAHEAQQS